MSLSKWPKCIWKNESILLMLVLLHIFLYSYNFFQIQSSSSTDSPDKSRSRGSRIFSPIQCCKMICNISPLGGLHSYKTLIHVIVVYTRPAKRDKYIESCDNHRFIKLRKIQCILIYLHLQLFPPT
jgi:hypothetical protein